MSADDGRRVTYLHIGTMKSGTSYLQNILSQNRDALRESGVRYLGRGTRAVWDVLSLRPETAKTVGAWQRLVNQASTTPEPVRLLSMEVLSTASAEGVRAIVDSFSPDHVEVIVTARDMARVIPSAWQNAVKHGAQLKFSDFVASITSSTPDRTSNRFWKQHDVGAIVARWAEVVGAENVHVVTVPRIGAAPDLLWERFCEVLGLDASAYDTSQGPSSNFSLSFSDAELLRRINRRVGEELSREQYNRYIRTFLANEVMRPPAKGGLADTAMLDADAYAWAIRRGDQMARELADAGIHVVGDLADLVPPSPDLASTPAAGSADGSAEGPTTDSAGGPAADSTGATTNGGALVAEVMAPRVTYPDSAVRAIAILLRKLIEIDPAGADERAAVARSKQSEGKQRNVRGGGRRG